MQTMQERFSLAARTKHVSTTQQALVSVNFVHASVTTARAVAPKVAHGESLGQVETLMCKLGSTRILRGTLDTPWGPSDITRSMIGPRG